MTSRKWLAVVGILVLVAAGSLYLRGRLSDSEVVVASTAANARQMVIDKGLPSLKVLVRDTKPSVVNISTTTIAKGMDGRVRSGNPLKDFLGGEDAFDRFLGDVPTREYKQRSLGSGFVIDKEGYILTNNHVVEKAASIRVRLSDGKEYDAKVVGRDVKTDIALIRISARNSLPVAIMGDSDKLEVGDWVVAVGNPYGLDHTVTAGIVSAKGRVIGQGPYDDFIQTDASINPGNSGGPLFNLRGEVVGINTAIFSGGQGIGFAIPIKIARLLLPQLKSKGRVVRGWLGVVVQKVTVELAGTFGARAPEGALVSDVVEDSPATKADLRRGDVVISFDGKPIRDMEQLPNMVAETEVGKRVKIGLIREGRHLEVEATIAEVLDEPAEAPPSAAAPEIEKNLGLVVQSISSEIARHLNLRDRKGVIITDIHPGSPAEDGDLRPGDIVREINRKAVLNMSDFRETLKKIGPGKSIVLLVKRDNMSFFAVVKGGR